MDTILNLATDERSARIILATLTEPRDTTTGSLLRQVGGMETLRLLEADTSAPGFDEATTGVWRAQLHTHANPAAARTALDSSERFPVLIPDDAAWPAGLTSLSDQEPYALWVNGDPQLLSTPTQDLVTISGARAATSYGEHVASMLASDLANQGRVVVAGAAYGIDGGAHRATLAADGATVAVLASGVDRPYPSGHRELIERIAQRGAVVSEIPPGGAPTRWRFIQRSRLLAAMSSATVIVEAGVRSGSLGVAEQARSLDRPVGAVPGPITSATSAGPLCLIRDHGAAVVISGDDVLTLMEGYRSFSGQRLDAQHSGVRREQAGSSQDRGLGL
ncbi:DNA processing protein [Brevibacterium aurantiacum]|uniref:DNA processing protein n=1 Tax=Brevibacterium aurantiacum TaxID=273384 RepID=A0A2H1IS26_BREAU|nr:DNA-processing protein DprA [Brevibacterium aurantiacum]SMX78007.1 DNA processing protein [Brevibacterium aurantiacum]